MWGKHLEENRFLWIQNLLWRKHWISSDCEDLTFMSQVKVFGKREKIKKVYPEERIGFSKIKSRSSAVNVVFKSPCEKALMVKPRCLCGDGATAVARIYYYWRIFSLSHFDSQLRSSRWRRWAGETHFNTGSTPNHQIIIESSFQLLTSAPKQSLSLPQPGGAVASSVP